MRRRRNLCAPPVAPALALALLGCGGATVQEVFLPQNGGAAGQDAAGVAGNGGQGGALPAGGAGGAAGAVVIEAGSCCEAAFTPGCAASEEIEQCVCTEDPYCCNTRWDGSCVVAATERCGGVCTGTGAGGSAGESGAGDGSCSTVKATPGCPESPVIESCVCAEDPSCCQVKWDELCVAKVAQLHCDPAGPAWGCAPEVVTADLCAFIPTQGATCAEATPLKMGEAWVQGATGGLGNAQGSCGGGISDVGPFCGNAGEVYFRYTAKNPKTKLAVILVSWGLPKPTTVCGSKLDAVVYVRKVCDDPTTELFCEAHVPNDPPTPVVVKIPEAGDVFIVIDGFNGDVGEFSVGIVGEYVYCTEDSDCGPQQYCDVSSGYCHG